MARGKEGSKQERTLFFFSRAASLVPNRSRKTASREFFTSTTEAHLSVQKKVRYVSRTRSTQRKRRRKSSSPLEISLLESTQSFPQIVPAGRLDDIELLRDELRDLGKRDVDSYEDAARSER